MATIIRERTTGGEGNGVGMLVSVIVLLVVVYVLFTYILPSMGRVNTSPQINVPGQVDVNLKQSK